MAKRASRLEEEREALVRSYLQDRAQALESKGIRRTNRKILDSLAAQEMALDRQEEIEEICGPDLHT